MKRLLSTITLAGLIALLPLTSSTPAVVSPETGRHWIAEMKQAPRGPFQRLRWFCNDGTVHPPKPYPCTEHGGGHQHGKWSDKTRQLRAEGYKIATLLAGVDAKKVIAEPDFLDTYAPNRVPRSRSGCAPPCAGRSAEMTSRACLCVRTPTWKTWPVLPGLSSISPCPM
jgi:hypothetical protein